LSDVDWHITVAVLFSGWVNELVGGQHSGAKGFMFFGVNVDLTESGIGTLSLLFCNMRSQLLMAVEDSAFQFCIICEMNKCSRVFIRNA